MLIILKYSLVVFLWHSFLKCYEGSWMTLVFCVTKTIAILLDQLHNEPTIFPMTPPPWYTSSAQSCQNFEQKKWFHHQFQQPVELGRRRGSNWKAAWKIALFPPHPSGLRVLLLCLSLQSFYYQMLWYLHKALLFYYLNDNFIFVFTYSESKYSWSLLVSFEK